ALALALHQKCRAAPGVPAEKPGRRQSAAIEEGTEGDLWRSDAKGPFGAQPAAMGACSARISDQPIAQSKHWIAMLENFDRRIAAIGMAGDFAVITVLERGSAGTHAVEMVVAIVAAGLGMDAAEEEIAARSAGGGRDALGYRFGKGSKQEIDKLRLQIGVAADGWSRMHDIDHASGGRNDPCGTIATCIPRDQIVRICDTEDGIVKSRGDHHKGAVHGSAHLWAGAGEICDDLSIADDEFYLHFERIGTDPVILDRHRGLVATFRQFGNLGAETPLGISDKATGAVDNDIHTVALGEFEQPAFANVEGADHGVEVAPTVAWCAVVGKDHPPKLLVVATALEKLYRWQA